MRKMYFLLLFLLVFSAGKIYPQKTISLNYTIQTDSLLGRYLSFDYANYEINEGMPSVYYVAGSKHTGNAEVSFNAFNYIPLSESELALLDTAKITSGLTPEYRFIRSANNNLLAIYFVPFRKNPANHVYEKLASFTYSVEETSFSENSYLKSAQKSYSYAENSALASGKWVKIAIETTGIYKLSYSDLRDMGFDAPGLIRVFGNGGGMLPAKNSEFRFDDLQENPIYIHKGADDVFNSGDYILFYAEGKAQWEYDENSAYFKHELHKYSRKNYYFLTTDAGEGKRIEVEDFMSLSENKTITAFDGYDYYEVNDTNLIKSGNQWFGEEFNLIDSRNYTFEFPDIITSEPAKASFRAVSRASNTSNFTVKNGQTLITTVSISGVDKGSVTGEYARINGRTASFNPSGSPLNIEVEYNKSADSDIGWLDYIALNVRQNLIFNRNYLLFRDIESVEESGVGLFKMQGANPNVQIWDVTNVMNIHQLNATITGSELQFKTTLDSLKQFAAVDVAGSFPKPEIIGDVENQNLHGLGNTEMVIICHPDFLEQAERLRQLHINKDGLESIIVTPQQVYNEFSSGKPDVTAYRSLMKMMYDRYEDYPKYLLLFGDGSYDNISEKNNSNKLLTYQSDNSTSFTQSYVSDDYFGFLDDSEGDNMSGDALDIGIGRIPVNTIEQAKQVVDKIDRYMNNQVDESWRNVVCFIGDDEDGNQHAEQADNLAKKVQNMYDGFMIEKIYLDAYVQESTPTGERYPDVNMAIRNRIRNGALLMNYTGHGGENGLGHEQIITVDDIKSWNNIDRLTVFVTATCEFSRFDDKNHTSAGEHILLNPKGAGVGLFSTTRLVYSLPNYILNRNFYDFAFELDENGIVNRMGDVIRLSKIATGPNSNKLNFSLLADPALKLNYASHKVVVDEIISDNEDSNEIGALSEVTVKGRIVTQANATVDDFNGTLFSAVFDKAYNVTTLANDNTPPFKYKDQSNILFKGKSSIKNGRFELNFVAPKDINYQLGNGLINFYATNGTSSAKGNYTDFIIGGSTDNPASDSNGPAIKMFINDTVGAPITQTGPSPKIIAHFNDENGINTTGIGIGHDITLIIDGDNKNQINLNGAYESNIDNFRSGIVEYQTNNLEPGIHTATIKAWDLFNNSGEQTISFEVLDGNRFNISNLYNYPNGFSDRTDFIVEHNSDDIAFNVRIEIYTPTGQVVNILEENFETSGYRLGPISWNGTSMNGQKLKAGIYIFRALITDSKGNTSAESAKLMIY